MESGFGSDFGSDFSSGAGGGGKLDPGLIMEQVKVQIAVANAQELLQVRRGRGGRAGGAPVPVLLCAGHGGCPLGLGGGGPAMVLLLDSARRTRSRSLLPARSGCARPGPAAALPPSRALSAAHDGQVLSEVHREARRSPGQLGAEVHRHVHGSVHGRLEHGFPSLQLSAAAGESQHVKCLRSWSREGPCGQGTSGQSGWLGVKSCCLSSPDHGRAINPP